MSKLFRLPALSAMTLAMALAVTASAQTPGANPPSPAEPFPSWAYPWVPDFQVPPADDAPQRLPGSTASVSWKQARDLFFVPDWHPEEHGPMPDIVRIGRKPDVRACSSCHRAGGTGGPENSSLAGLPAAYFIQQIAEFKNGARKYSGPQRSPVTLMHASVKDMTDAEVTAAANYYAALAPRKTIKVVESDTVPANYIARVFYARKPEGGTEPLGERIVDMPDDIHQFELRDTHAEFTAYVPVGSLAKGEALVKAARSTTTAPCTTCHGADLKGLGPIPGIAGRSPSYLFRQLYDFQHGARAGEWSPLMAPVVSNLDQRDMLAIVAYLASLDP